MSEGKTRYNILKRSSDCFSVGRLMVAWHLLCTEIAASPWRKACIKALYALS